MDILPWLPYIAVAGFVVTFIQTLWMVFMGPATIPDKWQVWQNKIRANPRPMLSVLFFVDVLLVCYITGYLWYLSEVIIDLPPLYGNEGALWPLRIIMSLITILGIIWLGVFAARMLRSVTQRTLLGSSRILKGVFRVNIMLAILAYVVVWGGGWYISTHPQPLFTIDTSEYNAYLSSITTQENLPLSCGCSNPVVNATLDAVAIPSSNEATATIILTNSNAEDINLSFEYVTLRDPKNGNKVYEGDYDSFVVPTDGSVSVQVVFHINTSHKRMYIFSMSLVKGSYWKHKYRDVTISL